MAIRKVIQRGDETLRKTSRDITSFDARLHVLLDDMAETMYAEEGVGLAAPQIGILRNVVVIDPCDGTGLVEMVNPVVSDPSGSEIMAEGCLSVRGVRGNVERPTRLTVKYQDRYGKEKTEVAEGFYARIICHETDHLKGVLFTDKVIGKEEEE